jgi:uncharacterized protein YrzB (UPF0473 family)
MSEIIVNMSGLGKFTMTLDLVDPSNPDDLDEVEVWKATFCDEQSSDCDIVFFEMGLDYEAWDLIDEAIQTYRQQTLPDEN